MNRRKFLKSLGFIGASAVVAPKLALELLELPAKTNPLFTGQLGVYDGVVIFDTCDQLTRQIWAKAVWEEVRHESKLYKILKDAKWIQLT